MNSLKAILTCLAPVRTGESQFALGVSRLANKACVLNAHDSRDTRSVRPQRVRAHTRAGAYMLGQTGDIGVIISTA